MTTGPVGPTAATEPLSHRQLAQLAVGLAGLQFCWAVQIGYVTRTLLQLHLAPRYVSLAWLAGPIAGIVVQPIVGVLSDRCASPLGRRRPYLIGGSTVTVFALASFAYAEDIGETMGVPPLLVAILSFWLLDFAINGAQGPLRALLADVAPPEQQHDGNAYFSLMTGIGNISGNTLGSVPLATYLPMFQEDGHALYVIAMVVLVITMAITVLSTVEKPLHPADGCRPSSSNRAGYESLHSGSTDADSVDQWSRVGVRAEEHHERQDSRSRIRQFYEVIRDAPFPFLDVFAVQCFTWFSWFTIFIFITSWVGAEVYNGSADAPPGSPERLLYDAGVRTGNFGLALQAFVSMVSSLAIPGLVRRFSVRTVLFTSHIFLGTALVSTLALHSVSQRYTALMLIASAGLPWAVTMTVPWGTVSAAIMRDAPSRSGQYLTLFNLSQCLPEVVVSVISTWVEARTKTQASVLALGGAVAYAGAAYVLARAVGAEPEMPLLPKQ